MQGESGFFFDERLFVEFSSLNRIHEGILRGGVDEESFQGRQRDFRLGIQRLGKPVLQGIPEHVYVLVRVDDIVLVSNEQIVQIVGVKNWFDLSVFWLPSFLFDVTVRFND